MSEEDVRGGLREAVADEPALDFDPDALVATARHQVKRRRALVAVGVATVAVAVAAVALPVALGRQTTQAADQPSAPTTSVTSPAPTPYKWPPAGVSAVHYTTTELRDRGNQMAGHLKPVVLGLLPTATNVTFGPFGGEAEGQFYEGQTSVNAAIGFTIGDIRYSMVVSVFAPGTPDLSPTWVCDTSGTDDCRQLGDQDGGRLVTTTDDLGGRIITSLYHFRKTGTVVSIAAYNYDVTNSEAATDTLPAVPLTLDQLMTLATDPDLAL